MIHHIQYSDTLNETLNDTHLQLGPIILQSHNHYILWFPTVSTTIYRGHNILYFPYPTITTYSIFYKALCQIIIKHLCMLGLWIIMEYGSILKLLIPNGLHSQTPHCCFFEQRLSNATIHKCLSTNDLTLKSLIPRCFL